MPTSVIKTYSSKASESLKYTQRLMRNSAESHFAFGGSTLLYPELIEARSSNYDQETDYDQYGFIDYQSEEMMFLD